jgi:hypothetical protein
MQKLQLAENVFDQLKMDKRTTIRLGSRDIQLGQLLFESNDLKRTLMVIVNDVYCCLLKDVKNTDMLNDGFKSYEEMCQQLSKFYPSITLNSEVTVVRF